MGPSDAATMQAELLTRLTEAEDTLRAIGSGEIDAFVVPDGAGGQRVFTLSTADRPYRMFVENMRDGAATVSANGTILYANARLADLLRCSKETVVGAPLTRFVSSAGMVPIGLEELRGPDGLGATVEIDLIDGDGDIVPVLVSASPLHVDGDQLTCVTFADVRGQRSHEREIARLEDQVERERILARDELDRLEARGQSERLESLGKNAGSVAHDFNNLLIGIQGYAASIKYEVEAAAAEREQHLAAMGADADEIERTVLRAANLTRQLLGFVRRETALVEVLDLNDVVADVEPLLRRTVGGDVELVVTLGPGVRSVHADRALLERVLVNLAVNARDAMPGGGRLTIETSTIDIDEPDASGSPILEPGTYVRLAVSDTGTGMTDSIKERAFEPFFTTKAEGGGTGLGLATVYGIINQSGGHIQIDSEAGIGTTITALLPASEALVSTPIAIETASQGKGTILVVEADDAIRGVMRRILATTRHEVLTAATGEEALRVAAGYDRDIALLISDLVLSDMLGKQLAETLIAARPTTTVLYTSGYPQGTDGKSRTVGPHDATLEKPFSTVSLLAAVHNVLNASKE
ncbi:MAG: hypothetical protein QOJ67_2569 [Acidimicrobiaceae bacterium]|jgi:PAS domain S-box-containing protein